MFRTWYFSLYQYRAKPFHPFHFIWYFPTKILWCFCTTDMTPFYTTWYVFAIKLLTATLPALAYSIPQYVTIWGVWGVIILLLSWFLPILLFWFPAVNLCTCRQWYSIREYQSEDWWYWEWCSPTDRRYWHTRNSFWKTECQNK